ncbi:MAG: hypothetical protein LBT12_07430 [Oscillospiraceae bacterium]|nr:hypothetical protein [Oscillospiraceae bacterium]
MSPCNCKKTACAEKNPADVPMKVHKPPLPPARTCGCPPIRCGCNAVVASVALAEAALAHILNAEGEKLQKILAVSDDPGDLLAVNESVRNTIIEVSELERILYSKLTAVCTLYGRSQNPCAGAEISESA